MNKFIISILIFMVIQSHSSTLFSLARIQRIERFFPEINGNLTAVTWDHSVYSLELLDESLENDAMMLVVDIVLGVVKNGVVIGTPIITHSQSVISDLSLEMFLSKIIDFNRQSIQHRKGVKLNFKTIETFEESVEVMRKLQNKINFPLWLNIDVLADPIGLNNLPVNFNKYFSNIDYFENSVMSLEWRTKYKNDIIHANYSQSEIDKIELILILVYIDEKLKHNNLTFFVRAGIAARSIPQLLGLLKEINGSTLTVWSLEDDPVDLKSLRRLIRVATVERVYIDFPKSLLDQLRLDKLDSNNLFSGCNFTSLSFFTSILALMFQIF